MGKNKHRASKLWPAFAMHCPWSLGEGILKPCFIDAAQGGWSYLCRVSQYMMKNASSSGSRNPTGFQSLHPVLVCVWSYGLCSQKLPPPTLRVCHSLPQSVHQSLECKSLSVCCLLWASIKKTKNNIACGWGDEPIRRQWWRKGHLRGGWGAELKHRWVGWGVTGR